MQSGSCSFKYTHVKSMMKLKKVWDTLHGENIELMCVHASKQTYNMPFLTAGIVVQSMQILNVRFESTGPLLPTAKLKKKNKSMKMHFL